MTIKIEIISFSNESQLEAGLNELAQKGKIISVNLEIEGRYPRLGLNCRTGKALVILEMFYHGEVPKINS